MDETFNRLINRQIQKKVQTLGNPWEIIPIKNKNIEQLQGLDQNFRLKLLYLQNNKLKTLRGSLEYLVHLETLCLCNNELRGLDDNIEFLKRFTQLKNLGFLCQKNKYWIDLYDNPLAEEPNYRLKLIYQLPTLELLDQHVITLKERQQAEQLKQKELAEQQRLLNKQKYHKKEGKVVPLALSSEEKKKLISQAKQKAKRLPVSQMFSKGEKLLYKEAEKLLAEIQAKQQEEEELMQFMITKGTIKSKEVNEMPKPPRVWELKDNISKNEPLSYITEWEKNKLKPLFKKYDTEKKAQIGEDCLEQIYDALQKDFAEIGKVPDCNFEEFSNVFTKSSDKKIQWDDFRCVLNSFKWMKLDEESLKQNIQQKYYEAHKLINTGQKDKAFQTLFKAIKLENALHLDDKEKPLYAIAREEEKVKRYDYFNFSTFKFKDTFTHEGKDVLQYLS